MSSDVAKAILYIVRHGECSGNVEQKLLEPSSDILTDVGRAQAKLLGQTLKNVSFTKAFSSDYPRAFEIAQIILNENCASEDLQPQPENRMRERDITGIAGMPAMDAISIMISAMKEGTSYLKVEMPKCETVNQFEERIIEFFAELVQNIKKSDKGEETILVVSHGLTIQRLMVLLNSRPEAFGIQQWTQNPFCEKLMQNTTFHKLALEVNRSSSSAVTGKVELAHSKDNTYQEQSSLNPVSDSVDDSQTKLSKYDQEVVQYCRPV